MAFTQNQEALVNASWELFQQNLPLYSVLFYSFILEKAPAAKNMFSFLRDTPGVEYSPKLQAHSEQVFGMVRDAAVQLRAEGEVVLGDATLGAIHIQKGVAGSQFVVVKEALLKTVKEVAGENWSEEMSTAWGAAYDGLATAIIRTMA